MMQDQDPKNDPTLSDDDEFLDDEFGDEFTDEEYDAATASGGDDVLGDGVGDEDMAYIDDEYGDDEWEDEDEEGDDGAIQAGAGAQKPKREGLGLSFNTMVITGAVVVGLCVLVWQVVSKRPDIVDNFTTALSMTGSSDGPIFGGTDALPPPETQPIAPEGESGLLNTPDGQDGAPPMPAPVTPAEEMSPEEQAGLPEPDGTLTPMPGVSDPTETASALDANGNPVPRSPDQSPPTPVYSIDARGNSETAEPNRAEDMLKNAIAAREQQQDKPADAFGAEETAPAPAEQAQVTPPAETGVMPPALVPSEQAAVVPPAAQTPAPAPAATPEQTAAANAANADLAQKMDLILSRMGDMDNRIGEINNNSTAQINAVRDEIRGEIATLKQNPPASGNAAPADNAQVTEQINAVREEMKTALAQISEDVKKATSAAPAPASSGGVSEAQLTEMRQEMQNQFAEMRKEMKAEIEKTAAANVPNIVVPVPAAPKQQAQAPAAEPAPKKAAAPKAAAPAPARTAWQLKAAKPGKAWVARAGTSNIQGVGVGDTLEGLGRITAISFVSGRWVVQGTNGSIRQ